MGSEMCIRDRSYPEKLIKAGAGKVLRKVGVLDSVKAVDMVSFVVDKNAAGYVRDVAPYERVF